MKNKKDEAVQYLPIGMSIGIAIGTAIGAVADNIPVFMSIGLGIGLCVGALADAKKAKESDKDDHK